MSNSKCISGSRVELFILKSWEPHESHDYDPEGLPEGVGVPILVAPVLRIHLADRLENVWKDECFGVGDLPKDGEQRFFKVWFDFAARKVLDVKCIKLETLNPDLDTYELENPTDPDAIAKVQACFDMPKNKTAFEDLEILVREGIAGLKLRYGSPPPMPNQNVYFTLSVPEGLYGHTNIVISYLASLLQVTGRESAEFPRLLSPLSIEKKNLSRPFKLSPV
jgi:hypothetical protein